MSDEFGPCPLCGGPREYDHLRETLLCVCCGEFADIGKPWHPVQILAERKAIREHAETYALMNDAERADAVRRRGWWKEDG